MVAHFSMSALAHFSMSIYSPKDEEIERISLPHQRERRLTPGEIQAIKDMRASPNIPEDAKPELPEGYE